MRILLSHQFFWPDTAPYALILRDIALRLAQAGHIVHVQSALPYYGGFKDADRSQLIDGLHIHRCGTWGKYKGPGLARALNALRYVISLVWRILSLRPDVVTASTHPPVVAAWAAALAARAVGARFVYHMQDIHPEVSEIAGGAMGWAPLATLFRAMDNATLSRADCVVTLSQDMADTLRDRGVPIRDLRLIPNPSLDDVDVIPPPLNPAWTKAPGKIRVIFAGNLGRFQNLALLADGVGRLFPNCPDLELLFLGDGVALPSLKARWGDHPQVRFLPQVPVGTARVLMAEADVGLVSLLPGMFRVASPSKVQTYAALGVKVLALVEPESRMAQELEARGGGVATRTLTPEGVAEALSRALATPCPPPIEVDPLKAWVELMQW